MDTETITLELPAQVYTDLQSLAMDQETDPAEMVARLIATARQHRAWLRDLTALREQIRQEGGLQVGVTKQEVVERLRQTRREIFEAEYAHLYR
jgi:hypothetical protein